MENFRDSICLTGKDSCTSRGHFAEVDRLEQSDKIKNQKSKIKNQKSKIKNQKSKIKNQKSKIKNQKSKTSQ